MISERLRKRMTAGSAGHWEGDLILGVQSSAIGTLVERTTRFTMLLHLPPMDGTVLELASRTAPHSQATAPGRYATPSRARSRPCLSNCDDR